MRSHHLVGPAGSCTGPARMHKRFPKVTQMRHREVQRGALYAPSSQEDPGPREPIQLPPPTPTIAACLWALYTGSSPPHPVLYPLPYLVQCCGSPQVPGVPASWAPVPPHTLPCAGPHHCLSVQAPWCCGRRLRKVISSLNILQCQ